MIHVDLSTARLYHLSKEPPFPVRRAASGKGGPISAVHKREGDGATPVGHWRVMGALLRPDRVPAPATTLPWRWLRRDDGWCDDPSDPAYNRPVAHPHPGSAERLWRDDQVYDIILVLDHNSGPVVPAAGSAIFCHLAREDWGPTEGCIAIERAAMDEILPLLGPGTPFIIAEGPPDPVA